MPQNKNGEPEGIAVEGSLLLFAYYLTPPLPPLFVLGYCRWKVFRLWQVVLDRQLALNRY